MGWRVLESWDHLKKTPLFEIHQKYGGKIVDFGGWALPVQFTGIIEEHRAVRAAAGLFDVSHMGEIEVTGAQALELVNYLITNDAPAMAVEQIIYSPMCYESGGIIDDLLVYRLGPERFMLVVNAANTEKDLEYIRSVAARFPGAQVIDRSNCWAQLALQGPNADRILQRLTRTDLSQIKYYWFRARVGVAGSGCLVSRTGYTGEDGFEIYCSPEDAPNLWDEIMEAGEDDDLVPCGLGARDTLRFEAKMPLYGHELDQNTTPFEAGLGFFVKLNKPEFLGREALARQKAGGITKKLAGFEMTGRGIPRAGYPIHHDGRAVGVVTSGTYAPTLDKNLGLGYVPVELAGPGTELEIMIRNRPVRAMVVKTPFYRRAK